MSRAFDSYSASLRELHRLIRAGAGDGDAADAVREAMDADWLRMTDYERHRARKASERLYREAEGVKV